MTAYPKAGTAWAMTAMLTIAYVLSYVDRSILGLLVDPVKQSLGVKDEAMGLLMGPAFALFYATMGVPLGWLVDRSWRSRLVAAGITLWSLATAASGLVSGFAGMFAARMAVGVGEATLSPAAMSMIADSFPPEKRGRPVALYSTALGLGAGIAGLLGAVVLKWAKSSAGLDLPLIGPVAAWQFCFLALGVPGILLGLGFLLVPEPPRQSAKADAMPLGAALGLVWARRGAFLGVMALASVMTIIAYSHGFNAPAFARTYGWAPERYAALSGLLLLAVGPATVAGSGWIIDKWREQGHADAPFRLLRIGFCLMVPAAALPFFMGNPYLALGLLALCNMGIAICTASGINALLAITPAPARGTIVAIYYMVISIAGLGLGPTTVGVLSTRVFGEAELRLAVAMVPIIFGLLPLLLLPRIGRAWRAEQVRVAG